MGYHSIDIIFISVNGRRVTISNKNRGFHLLRNFPSAEIMEDPSIKAIVP